MSSPKPLRSRGAVGLALAVAAGSSALGCTSAHTPPAADAAVSADAAPIEDASPWADAVVLADAGPGPVDAGWPELDAADPADAGAPDAYPEYVRG